MPRKGTWSKRAVVACTAVIILAGAFLAGFVTSDRDLISLRHRNEAKSGLEINTALIRIATKEVPVPGEPGLRGGGITIAGNTLVGITGDGEFFRLAGDKVTMLDVRPPDNHLDDYKSAATSVPSLAALRHDFSLYHYYAPLYVQSGDQHLLFLTYTEWQPQAHCYALAVARLDLPSASPAGDFHADGEDWNVIYRARPCLPVLTTHDAVQGHMGGGAMAFDPASDRLLVATGDYRIDGLYAAQTIAQDDATDYGKLLALSLDGSSVTHLAKGLRNSQGLLLLPDGQIWETEHGPRGGDELNHIVTGGNFGWPFRTLGTRYSALPWPLSPTNGHHDAGEQYESPVYAWVPSVGISGLTRVDGFDPAWDGDFLAASLRAQTLFRLRMSGGKVQYTEPLVMQHRIRQVLQLPGREIALWTDSRKVVFLRPAEASRTLLRARRDIAGISGKDTLRAKRLEAALGRCMECHSLDQDAAGSNPHLTGVLDRRIAATSYANYSAALRAAGGSWTRERLATFLADPQKFAPGTPMPPAQLAPETLADLVRLLEGLDSPE